AGEGGRRTENAMRRRAQEYFDERQRLGYDLSSIGNLLLVRVVCGRASFNISSSFPARILITIANPVMFPVRRAARGLLCAQPQPDQHGGRRRWALLPSPVEPAQPRSTKPQI